MGLSRMIAPVGPLAEIWSTLDLDDVNYSILLERTGLLEDDLGHTGDERGAKERKEARKAQILEVLTSRRAAPFVADVIKRRTRAQQLLSRRSADHGRLTSLTLTSISPLAIGIGIANPTEHSVTLAPPYGSPIIPGQALKGAAARALRADPDPDVAAAADRLFGAAALSRLPAGADDTARSSSRARPGAVNVADALPTRATIDWEVLTPHVTEYYQSSPTSPPQPPAGYWQPVPSTYLVVAPGARFHTTVTGPDGASVDLAVEAITVAAEDRGLGAKTSSGLGFFDVEVTS